MIKPTVVDLAQSLNQASGIIFSFAGSHALPVLFSSKAFQHLPFNSNHYV